MKYKFIVLSERALEDAKAIIKSEGGKLFIIIIAAKQAILSIPVLNPGTAKPQTCGISLNFSSFGDGDCNCDRYGYFLSISAMCSAKWMLRAVGLGFNQFGSE